MIAEDEDALFCDFAETYHILDFYALPVGTAARLAAGLRDNSRIKTKINGLNEPMEIFLLAEMVDTLHYLLWAKTKDGEKNRNRPKRLSEMMIHKEKENAGFSSIDEFNAVRNRILGIKDGN